MRKREDTGRRVLYEKKSEAGWNTGGEKGRQRGRYTSDSWNQQPGSRCFLTQHNVTTIVLKLAAVGYSAAAFPCEAFRMKPRQRRVAAGAAQTSPYPDRPLTALRRRPFLPSSSLQPRLFYLPSTSTCSMRSIPTVSSSFVVLLPLLRTTSYILPHCAPSLSVATRVILTFWIVNFIRYYLFFIFKTYVRLIIPLKSFQVSTQVVNLKKSKISTTKARLLK